MSFQINSMERRKSEFLKIGEIFPGTKWQVTKFEQKLRKNPKTGEDDDRSELTLTNLQTSETAVLVLGARVDATVGTPRKAN